ncbi:hypothetical protein ACVWZX_004699 [Deinococcus sp. UYEF24]
MPWMKHIRLDNKGAQAVTQADISAGYTLSVRGAVVTG